MKPFSIVFILNIFLPQLSLAQENCIAQEITFQQADFQVHVLKYESRLPKPKSILILPPTGGINFLDRSYARSFCESGFNVFILKHWTHDDEYSLDLQIHERFYARALRAIEIVLSHQDSGFIGLLGTSVGAIHVANAVRKISRLDAAFYIVGGTPASEVLANSDQDILVKARKKRFDKNGYTNIDDYIQALGRSLSFDSLHSKANPSVRIGMVVASSDTTVPTKNQLKLQNEMAPEHIIKIDGNHLYAILTTWIFRKKEIVSFFNRASTLASNPTK